MHTIEPFVKWRDKYISTEDEHSLFYKKEYNEFQYTDKIYNYYIHPQWDFFGSSTLVLKILYIDYEQHLGVIELMGEWNDCIGNDIMFLKREIADHFYEHGINKYILLCDNVLNYHGSDTCYYEEWREEVQEDGGWICLVNLSNHVIDEMEEHLLTNQVNLGENFSDIFWQALSPIDLMKVVQYKIENQMNLLY